jgi:hypothetical protein
MAQIKDPLKLLRKINIHGPKNVASEWKEIIKNFVAIDGQYNKVLVTNATGCSRRDKIKIYVDDFTSVI